MKKIILISMIILSSITFTVEVIESSDIYNENSKIGEIYIGEFDNSIERKLKMQIEKNELLAKENFKEFKDKNGKVLYLAGYKTPENYVVSFKGYCENKYISVYGKAKNFEQLLDRFLRETKKYGYDF